MLAQRGGFTVFPFADRGSGNVVQQPLTVGVRLGVEVRGGIHIGILDGTRIKRADQGAGVGERVAVSGFVAERPDQDRWMIAVLHDHPPYAVQRALPPFGTVAGKFAAVIG